MIRTVTAFSAAAFSAALLATSAFAAERSWTPSDFDEIEVRGPYDVVVTTGGSPLVRAQGSDDALERLEIRTDGDRLIITSKRSGGLSGLFGGRDDADVRVLVNTERLNAASLSGSGDLVVDRMDGDDVKIAMSGSGDINVGAVRAGSAKIAMSGSGDISAAGACNSASISISGSGEVQAGDLACKMLTVSIAGSGDVYAHASDTATAKIAGSGDVFISGGARCSTKVSGSGEVQCGA
ncbi:hypothetical protein B5C34_10405 [Pacificimonas flava]|uniref:DUF2807 domain-containing protein n=2 Tax=Pacificimonas TaxID=1960290 RepID=A0ABS7WLW8_9SPHN|nr:MULTISPECIES: head GIN domain-containing protein [Pacificimonas]MBZ6378920.1 DUF2807 domain-containing protein [Pacificimonas aurantium]OWV33829.1 hypothetical protein B5C34_10405 [Pacificimonas flava]